MTQMKVQDVMTSQVAAVRQGTPFKEIARVLTGWRVSAVPVLDENDRLAGVVSEADLMRKEEFHDEPGVPLFSGRHERAARAKAAGDTAGQVMTTPVVTIGPSASVVEAAKQLDRHGVKRLFVVDESGGLVGVVSRGDLLKVFLRTDDEIREEVVREVFMRVLWADPTQFEVQVRDGVVTLTGELPQKSSIPIAVRHTRLVDGVVDVIDRLTYTIDDTGRSRGHQAVR
jgi:CBS-domain-containing membrane protein